MKLNREQLGRIEKLTGYELSSVSVETIYNSRNGDRERYVYVFSSIEKERMLMIKVYENEMRISHFRLDETVAKRKLKDEIRDGIFDIVKECHKEIIMKGVNNV